MIQAMETRLDHVRANVADLRRAVEWYTTVLGFEVGSLWPADRPNYAHFKSAGGATFAVMEAEGRGARFNFTVDDPDSLWAELKDRVAVIEPAEPTAAADGLVVRVRASSVNPVDNAIAAGMLRDIVDHDFPVVLGRDYAGTVETIGADVEGYAVGDEVFGFLLHAHPTVHEGS